MESFLKYSRKIRNNDYWNLALFCSSMFFFLLHGTTVTVALSLSPLEKRKVWLVTDIEQTTGARHLGLDFSKPHLPVSGDNSTQYNSM